MSYVKLVLFALISTFMLAACGGAAPAEEEVAAFTVVREASLDLDAAVPSAEDEGDVVLTVSGNIDADRANGEDGMLALDMAMLEALQFVEVTPIDDYQATGDEAGTAQGVLLRDVLALAGVPDDAETLRLSAVDGYSIEMPISDTEMFDVLIATQWNGEAMEVANFGPLRIVYPYHAHEIDAEVYDPRWIWSVTEISVE